ncbi:MAG: hypothetical protein NWQ31_02460 [Polaribacter sp.]|nr:hypothetical protein [Polaribacter sp.]
METKKTSQIEMQEQKIQLVKGGFTPNQASDVVMSLLNQKINYHKLESIQQWEQNHKYDREPLKKRIQQLEAEKEIAAEFISKIKLEGKKLNIEGILVMKATE